MMSQQSGSSGERLSFELDRDLESSQNQQITLALEQYAKLKRAGRLPPRDEFLARHPGIADALGECLDGFELVEDAAGHFALRDADAEDADLLALAAQARRRAGRSRLIRDDARGRDDFRRAIRIYEELIVRFPERSALRLALIETLSEFAAVLVEPMDSAEAQESARRALELANTIGATD
jgi:hypothetical protein